MSAPSAVDLPFTAAGRRYVAVVHPSEEGGGWRLVAVHSLPDEALVGVRVLRAGVIEREVGDELPPAVSAVLPGVLAAGLGWS